MHKIGSCLKLATTYFYLIFRRWHTMIYCNNNKCKYNEKLTCNAGKVYCVDRLCVTFRHKPHETNYKELMKTSSPNCHKDGGGKFKSNRVTGVLK